jgi:type II secretory pathway component PulJ
MAAIQQQNNRAARMAAIRALIDKDLQQAKLFAKKHLTSVPDYS